MSPLCHGRRRNGLVLEWSSVSETLHRDESSVFRRQPGNMAKSTAPHQYAIRFDYARQREFHVKAYVKYDVFAEHAEYSNFFWTAELVVHKPLSWTVI